MPPPARISPMSVRISDRLDRRADPRVDPGVAHEVAAAYLGASSRDDPLTTHAYAQLTTESDRLFRLLTSPDRPNPLGVFFTTCRAPYRDSRELIASVIDDRILEVATVAVDPDRRHPLMDSEQGGSYDRFRAVHDVLGHGRLGLGFDRNSEFAVWLAQERFHSALARRALATELHGQHSVLWTTGHVAEPKAVLLDPELLRRSRHGEASAQPPARRVRPLAAVTTRTVIRSLEVSDCPQPLRQRDLSRNCRSRWSHARRQEER